MIRQPRTTYPGTHPVIGATLQSIFSACANQTGLSNAFVHEGVRYLFDYQRPSHRLRGGVWPAGHPDEAEVFEVDQTGSLTQGPEAMRALLDSDFAQGVRRRSRAR